MKNIKFRGLSTVQPHLGFKYGYFYQEWNYGHPTSSIIRDYEGNLCIIDEETLGQFTGFLDRNGKEIFEGDIVLYQNQLVCEVVDNKFEYALKCIEVKTNNSKYSSMEWTKNVIGKHYNFSEVFLSPTTNEVEIIGDKYNN